MKRDMDLIRDLLLRIEGGEKVFETPSGEAAALLGIPMETTPRSEDAEKLEGHLDLLEQAGFIEVQFRSLGGTITVKNLTWDGHDFVDSVRDQDVWRKTKSGALAAGGWTMDTLKDLAKAFVRKQIEDRTGLRL